jgi:uncharacterized repeat protein (TIGR03803 family)
MKSRLMLFRMKSAVAALVCILSVVGTAGAGTQEKVLHAFAGTVAVTPQSALLADGLGNFYGVTADAVYELSPAVGGAWKFQVLHTLITPYDIPGGTLARDSAGNLYGATWQGGAKGCGYIYQLSPGSGGGWDFKVLYAFACSDGAAAAYSMVFDAKGNLYGGTHNGGAFDEGVAFELSPGTGGAWTYKMLHEFSTPEGNGPQTGVTFDSKGNLMGGNETGIWQLNPNGDGTWTESTAYSFNDSADGFNPLGDLTWDTSGNLYGTNQAAGRYSGGTAFMLTPNAGGGWTSTVLHSFGATNDGYYPNGGLTLDSSGNIYGTAEAGGGPGNDGIAFKLTPSGSGTWTESILHRFGPNGSKGGTFPSFNLYLDAAGNLYGVTGAGGTPTCGSGNGCGVVYEIVP